MFDDKNLLITGGTGSFGKKFVETVLKKYKPKKTNAAWKGIFKIDWGKKTNQNKKPK